jgi:hypothetical protein
MNRDYAEDSVIVYSPFGGADRVVRVTEKSDNIKNGAPGFSGILLDTETLEPIPAAEWERYSRFSMVWGYDDQITKVLELA